MYKSNQGLGISITNYKHIYEVDYLRGIAILAVVMIHTTAHFTNMDLFNWITVSNILIDVFSHFAVPLFILISGLVLSIKYYKEFQLFKFYKKRMGSVIPQYLIFSFFYIAIIAIYTQQVPSIYHLVYDIFTANAYYHMWFFALIIQLYIVYPIIIKIYKKYNDIGKAQTLVIASLFIQIFWNILVTFISMYYTMPIINKIMGIIFISHIFYFLLGIHVCKNIESTKEKVNKIFLKAPIVLSIILTLAISSTWVVGTSTYGFSNIPKYYNLLSNVLQPVLCILIFVICYRLTQTLMENKTTIKPLLPSIGKYSFGIFLIHPFIMEIIVVFLKYVNITNNEWIFYPILFVTTVTLSYITTIILSYLPYSNIIIGVNNIVQTIHIFSKIIKNR